MYPISSGESGTTSSFPRNYTLHLSVKLPSLCVCICALSPFILCVSVSKMCLKVPLRWRRRWDSRRQPVMTRSGHVVTVFPLDRPKVLKRNLDFHSTLAHLAQRTSLVNVCETQLALVHLSQLIECRQLARHRTGYTNE
ncbi:recQ-mediated genome instability protein 1 isoform X2 [Eubalaena glacialis]|uniref:recQ-mediated genome instability protein 1 isoform X2 n=1 Tax=Eubalaena glacialis TaxID=27606 RepID=UPI002A5A2C34|nr:recQ-mediated genome instability protein 1 isoform X2 [Eubalaena glacialis]XP_061056525.1 recQ-mediated genome instability protein 1 isoform X2 [Eubalaena glacialis]XP_061056526.1 recQ-mediated genome instability protein 1 isoform X2 [Eubalaena glacialis]